MPCFGGEWSSELCTKRSRRFCLRHSLFPPSVLTPQNHPTLPPNPASSLPSDLMSTPLPTTTLSQAPTPAGFPFAARRRQGRREWHDKGLQHEGLRQRLIEYVLTRLHDANMTPSWYPQRIGAEAPAVAAKRLEEELYFSAASIAEYADEETLQHRLMCLAYPAARSSMQPPVEISVPCNEVEHVDAPTLAERCETPQRFSQRSGIPIHRSTKNLLDFTGFLSSPHSVSTSGEDNHSSAMDDDVPLRSPRTEYNNPSAFLLSIPHLTGKRTRAQIPLSPAGQGGFNFSSKALFSPKDQDLLDQQ